ncbi:hypothetical protein BC936DRAFT_137961 [Jimgerdemannia flammicorona]|uniref:F-box domain-containing protein n=1 Tax=Jimgerdemannia flammicorona TaxID=994334 RepID=A0A433CWA2_9FUNG|nr:hypothetical protein BC936DRAFT_137961 [Jimgerdemannia flammicorona]
MALHLNPAILREVFLYLVPPKPFAPYDIPFDLFVCTLVCRAWHHDARPLLDGIINYANFHSLFYHNSTEKNRIAQLLAESKRNGLDYHKMVVRMIIDATYVNESEFEREANALDAILKLNPPNLIELLVYVDFLAGSPATTLNPLLIQCLQSLSPSIKRIHLQVQGDATSQANHKHLVDLISVIAPQLLAIKLSRFTLDSDIVAALRCCTELREIDLDHVNDDHRLPNVPPWPKLLVFKYAQSGRAAITRTVVGLAKSCRHLNSFTFETDSVAVLPAIKDTALAALLQDLPELRRLRLARVGYVNRAFLAEILLPRGAALEHIDLEGCSSLSLAAIEPHHWPALKSLQLVGCHMVGARFVRAVVDACPAVEVLVLPDHLMSESKSEMGLGAFQRERKVNTWSRVEGLHVLGVDDKDPSGKEVVEMSVRGGESLRGSGSFRKVWKRVRRALSKTE